MKIIIQARHTYENQITAEDVEQAVFESCFEVSEILLYEDTDEIARLWAELEEIPYKDFPVLWDDIKGCDSPKKNKWGKLYNPNAGKERNQRLIEQADGLIYFWNEMDKNTEWLIKDLKKTNKRVYFHKPNVEYIL